MQDFLNLNFIFICCFSAKVICPFKIINQKKLVCKIENEVILHIFDQMRVLKYRCKTGISIFEGMVT